MRAVMHDVRNVFMKDLSWDDILTGVNEEVASVKLCGNERGSGASQTVRSQAELGNEINETVRSQAELGNEINEKRSLGTRFEDLSLVSV
jgi:hypothetical protein